MVWFPVIRSEMQSELNQFRTKNKLYRRPWNLKSCQQITTNPHDGHGDTDTCARPCVCVIVYWPSTE